jgi:ribA/ribD-fused uncharacterized protein
MGANAFTRAEQAMMYEKAMLFGDIEIASQILETDDPARHQELGRSVSGFVEEVWNEKKYEIVYQINLAKFSQNKACKKALLETIGTTLVETNPDDIIWGIGLSEDDPKTKDRETWRGQNLLGQILTEVREELKNQV